MPLWHRALRSNATSWAFESRWARPALELRGAVLKRAAIYLIVGLVIGLLMGRVVSTLFASLLFQVQPGELSIYATVAALLLSSGLAAAGLPALRAAPTDPIIALRAE